ncbi:MAG TPA: hypothetical protein VJ810_37250 [Blastocatellia bacterium]|nr:hypothetical protein [Blastocatellia bacterium]
MNKYLTTLILIAAVALLSVPVFSNQSEDKPRAGKAKKEQLEAKELSKRQVESKKVPEGATVKGNTVTLKAGYKFVKQAGGSVVVERKNGGVTGEFKCSCKSTATTKGGCDFGTVGGDTAKCFSNGCSDCLLETIVKGGTAATAPLDKKQ